MISTDNFVAEQALNQRQFTALKARDAEWRRLVEEAKAETKLAKGTAEANHKIGLGLISEAATLRAERDRLKRELAEAKALLVASSAAKDAKHNTSVNMVLMADRDRLMLEVDEARRSSTMIQQDLIEAHWRLSEINECDNCVGCPKHGSEFLTLATPAEQAQQPQGVNPSPPFMRDDQGRSRAAEQAQGEGAKGLADDLREANENIERMKARYKEQSAELRAMEEDRDNWRQKRVDVGIAYDHFAARHKGPGCGRREADAHIAALAKRVDALANLVTSLARDSATQGAMVEVQNKVAALEAERPGKGWVGHYCDQPTACPHRMTPPAPPPPEAAGPGHVFVQGPTIGDFCCHRMPDDAACGRPCAVHAVPPIPEVRK